MNNTELNYGLPWLNDSKNDLTKEWYVEYTFQDSKTGKQRRRRIYKGINELATEKARRNAAKKIMDDISNKLISGWTPQLPNKVRFENHIAFDIHANIFGRTATGNRNFFYHMNMFLDSKKPYVKRKTLMDYTSKLRGFYFYLQREGLGDINSHEVTREHIVEFNMLLRTGKDKLEPRTIKDYNSRIRQLFEWLIEKQLLIRNPVYDMPEFKQTEDYSAQPMMQEDASRLLEFIKKNNKQLWLFCAMIFYCAIRPGHELRLLRLKDINLFAKTITIREENAKTDYGVVNIPNPMYEILADMNLGRYDRECFLFGKEGEPGKTNWSVNYFREKFNTCRDKLGYPKSIKLYSWKCTGAILFAINGASTIAIRDHLRHKNTTTTDIYLGKHLGRRHDDVENKFPEI